MARGIWIAIAVVLTGAALTATYLIEPDRKPAVPAGPAATPFGWTGHIALLAGDGITGLRDGAAAQARFADPYGIVRGRDGTLYVADAGDNNRIRRIAVDGNVSSFAGSVEGFADGAGTAAAFDTPSGLAMDRSGNLYVADTGNHAIRRIDPHGVVTTVAGDGTAGYRDGAAAQARFNGPIGVAVDASGQVFVADTYNDRIRVIATDGTVRTLAGGDLPGYADGAGAQARFDTPTALTVDAMGRVWVADTRNHAVRRVDPQGVVTTFLRSEPGTPSPVLHRPLSLAVTHDGVLYVAEVTRGTVLQVSADARQWQVISGATQDQRLSRPAGMALGDDGALYLTDATAYRVHRIATTAPATPAAVGPSPDNPLPNTAGRWPLQPQDGWHEVVGTLGEVRGNFQRENRDHLHSGLDIRGDIGQPVLAIADAKVSNPSATWGFGKQGEGIELDAINYIHMRVGRTAQGKPIDPARFLLLDDPAGKPERVRVPRGTRFQAGDVLGTINPMAHVHLSIGANGYERNAIALGFVHYADAYTPRIDRIELLDAQDQPLSTREAGRVLLSRDMPGVQIVVDAWDQVDRNLPRRRLGLYALGYQWMDANGQALPGYEAPRMNIEFNRMPSDPDAVKVVYGPNSGITVHGSSITRFQYLVTNTVRDGVLTPGLWQPAELPAGDYTLRITARDYSGNVASSGRDLPVRLR